MKAKNGDLSKLWSIVFVGGLVLPGSWALAFPGPLQCPAIASGLANFASRYFPLNPTVQALTARDRLINAVLGEQPFKIEFASLPEEGGCRSCGTRDNHQYSWSSRSKAPILGPWLGELGFQYRRHPQQEMASVYSVEVPFGQKRLRMDVQVRYSTSRDVGSPIYEPTETGGQVFYGYGRTTTTHTPDGLQIQLATDGTWGILFTEDYAFQHRPTIDAEHSFDELNLRARLALDLTRQKIRTFQRDGIEKMNAAYPFTAPIEMGFPLGRGDLTETGALEIGLDSQGHFLVFIANLQWALSLPKRSYNQVRDITPEFKRIDLRRDQPTYYEPRPGDPYEVR